MASSDGLFFQLHSGLPREGPGNRASTLRALDLVGPLPAQPRILDVACGPGAQTLDLAAALPDAEIWAVDLHPPFLQELRRRAGANPKIHAVHASMDQLPFCDSSFDLIWCEGAAYIMGVSQALSAWRPLLSEGGRVAFSEAVWLGQERPGPALTCWREYPAMTDVPGLLSWVEQAGYQALGHFTLPPEAWWHDYYGPLESRLAQLEESLAGEVVVREARQEIETYREFGHTYGYEFVIVRVSSCQGPR